MKKNRKLFNPIEKIVIFCLSVGVLLLSAQVAHLYAGSKEEARATAGQKVSDTQVLNESLQREEADVPEAAKAKSDEKMQHQELHKEDAKPSHSPKKKANREQAVDKQIESQEERDKEAAKNKEESERKVAYLTIDDGPTEVDGEILDLLAEYGAKATFFMLEPPMRQFPDVVKRIVEEGHVPALHGVTHDVKKFYRSKQSVLDEMHAAQKTLEELTGVRATLIRTPYGSSPNMTPAYKQAVAEHGYQLWDWNVDSRDWKYTNGKYVEHAIQQIEYVSKKGEDPIILIHSRRTTLNHLPKLLDYLVEQGYSLEGLDESMVPYILP